MGSDGCVAALSSGVRYSKEDLYMDSEVNYSTPA